MNHHETHRFRRRGYEPRARGYEHRERNYEPRPRSMVDSLVDAARENPMSAALIGMGALWLFMGGNRMSLIGGDGRSSLVGTVAHGTGTVAKGAAHAASRAGEAVSSTVSSAASGVADTVSSAAHRVSDYVGGQIHGVDAQSAYHDPNLAPEQSDYSSGQERYDVSGYGQNRSFMSRHAPIATLRNNMQDMFERNPMALGVAGLVLGAGIAASLPLTRKEQETLGAAGDVVRQKASEVAEQAKDMASAVVDEVKTGMNGAGTHSTNRPM